jgi:hypothetical protein
VNLPSPSAAGEPPRRNGLAGSITLRRLVLTLISTAGALLVHMRTGDAFTSVAIFPLAYRFLAYWVRGDE